jgi:hypothetical protein
MGTLVYNGGLSIPIDDRTLAHLQVVVIDKLRRRESFGFTANVDGRDVVSWLGPSTPLEFRYVGNRRPVLNREWLELLALSAQSVAGLVVIPEPRSDAANDLSRPTADTPGRGSLVTA